MKELENTVVELPTKETLKEFEKMCEKNGWRKIYPDDCWRRYNTRTCAEIKTHTTTYSKGYCEAWKYNIITLNQLKMMNLKVGDIITNKNTKRKVLGICGEVYFVSYVDDFGCASNNTYTLSELEVYGYKLKSDSPSTKEVTMEEVNKLFQKEKGYTVKIKE